MPKTHSFRDVVAASVLASVFSVAALWFVYAAVIAPEPAFARSPGAPDVVLYTGPRGEDDKETFIFHSPETGDIWVYRDHKLRNHYRVTQLGADLEKLD